MKILGYLAIGLASTIATISLAHAELRVVFDEGAPKDTFRIQNLGSCPITASSVTLDLSTAKGGLIFDVTDSGAGVEVFQPFDLVSGAENLGALPQVADGQTAIELAIRSLAPSEAISFTIDVDDTRGVSETMVSGAEIEGATIRLSSASGALTSLFASNAEATLALPEC